LPNGEDQEPKYLERLPYNIIASYVYDSANDSDEENEMLNANLNGIEKLSEQICSPQVQELYKEFCSRIRQNYLLSKAQKSFIMKNVDSLNKSILSSSERLDNLNDSIKGYSEEVINFQDDMSLLHDEIEEYQINLNNANDILESTKSDITTQFVSILGIFSALMFGMVTGFDGLAKSIDALVGSNFYMGEAIISIVVIAMGLFSFSYCLIKWIGELIDKSKRKTDDNIENDSLNNTKNKQLFEEHALYLIVMCLLFILLVIGIIILVLSHSGHLSNIYGFINTIDPKWVAGGFLSAAVLIIIVCILCIFRLSRYLKK
jgi:ABC-type antimicrobial peptide transport system permease subunit